MNSLTSSLLFFAVFASFPLASYSQANPNPTFSRDIAPILFAHCSSCHRPGEAAPFPLTTFEETTKRAKLIEKVIKTGYMPPWQPVKGHGVFLHDPSLTQAQIQTISAWVASGTPQGDPAKTPPFPDFPSGWQLGQPDLVVTMEEAFEVPADGPDIYRNFVLPLDLPEDKWVRAVEIRPTARTVLHHTLFFLDDSGTARELDAQEPGPGFRKMGFPRSGSLGGWAVGGAPKFLPFDLAMPLPQGADLVISSHFHPSGKPEKEKTTIGLFFAPKPPSQKLMGMQLPAGFGRHAGINIPPGEENFRIADSLTLPVDAKLISVAPHAHYLGKTFRATATLPSGTTKDLFFIDNWYFNWQDSYFYKEPILLPAGTTVKVEITYDNSAANPNQQFDPPRRIQWGEESTDEMGSLSFGLIAANPADETKLGLATIRKSGGLFGGTPRTFIGDAIDKALQERVMKTDRNRDGAITPEEMPPEHADGKLFKQLDTDNDGKITRTEVESGWHILRKLAKK